MLLKYKKLDPNAVTPFQATTGSSKLDLTPISVELTRTKSGSYRLVYGFGLAFEFGEGVDLKLYPRSSQSKFDLTLSNGVGIGDSDYRGEYKAIFNIDFSNLKVDTFTKHTYKTLTLD
jgi:dUTPase